MIHITIDGLTGSGKTAVAKKLAEKFDILFFDTDLLISGICLFCLQNGINPTIDSEVQSRLYSINIYLKNIDHKVRLFLNNRDVTNELNNNLVLKNFVVLTKKAYIADYINIKQKEAGTSQSLVVEGFDCGKKVFPNTKFKYFLTADSRKRAERKVKSLHNKQIFNVSYQEILDEMDADEMNMFTGETSQADSGVDTVYIDTTDLDIVQTTEKIYGSIKEKILGKRN